MVAESWLRLEGPTEASSYGCDTYKTLSQLGLHYLICLKKKKALCTLLRFYIMYIQINLYISEFTVS